MNKELFIAVCDLLKEKVCELAWVDADMPAGLRRIVGKSAITRSVFQVNPLIGCTKFPQSTIF